VPKSIYLTPREWLLSRFVTTAEIASEKGEHFHSGFISSFRHLESATGRMEGLCFQRPLKAAIIRRQREGQNGSGREEFNELCSMRDQQSDGISC
jgi:hypothetical protein